MVVHMHLYVYIYRCIYSPQSSSTIKYYDDNVHIYIPGHCVFTQSSGFELYLMCCGVMLLVVIVYIYIYKLS